MLTGVAKTALHRTTVDIDVEVFDRARVALGTRGYRDTIDEALRQAGRRAALRRTADAVRAGGLELVRPEDFADLRALPVPGER